VFSAVVASGVRERPLRLCAFVFVRSQKQTNHARF